MTKPIKTAIIAAVYIGAILVWFLNPAGINAESQKFFKVDEEGGCIASRMADEDNGSEKSDKAIAVMPSDFRIGVDLMEGDIETILAKAAGENTADTDKSANNDTAAGDDEEGSDVGASSNDNDNTDSENETDSENTGNEAGNETVDSGNASNAGDNSEVSNEAEPIAVVDSRDYLVLINKEHPAGKDYAPDDLVMTKYYADRSYEGYRYMREVAAAAYNELVEGALADGYDIRLTSAYRSYRAQETLYNNYVAKDGQAAADRYSARPGKSEHQTGLSADVSAASVNWRLTQAFADTEEGKWLADNAHKYGFIIRFPNGKESITGYMYEPWHIRYVGKEHAQKIYEQQTTLEEYLGQ